MPEVSVERPVEEKEAGLKAAKPQVKISELGRRVLKESHTTEKAADLVKKNWYTFKVWPRVNKVEVKKAVEGLYDVDVLDVKIINIPRRRRRLGKVKGWRGGYKKAIVKLKEGQTIEVLPR